MSNNKKTTAKRPSDRTSIPTKKRKIIQSNLEASPHRIIKWECDKHHASIAHTSTIWWVCEKTEYLKVLESWIQRMKDLKKSLYEKDIVFSDFLQKTWKNMVNQDFKSHHPQADKNDEQHIVRIRFKGEYEITPGIHCMVSLLAMEIASLFDPDDEEKVGFDPPATHPIYQFADGDNKKVQFCWQEEKEKCLNLLNEFVETLESQKKYMGKKLKKYPYGLTRLECPSVHLGTGSADEKGRTEEYSSGTEVKVVGNNPIKGRLEKMHEIENKGGRTGIIKVEGRLKPNAITQEIAWDIIKALKNICIHEKCTLGYKSPSPTIYGESYHFAKKPQ